MQVGTITLLTLTGLLVFMLFFLAATINAVIISLLVSLAAAGGFLALFFACLTAIYIGALSVAAFVISAATISAIVAVLVASGTVICSYPFLLYFVHVFLIKSYLKVIQILPSLMSNSWEFYKIELAEFLTKDDGSPLPAQGL